MCIRDSPTTSQAQSVSDMNPEYTDVLSVHFTTPSPIHLQSNESYKLTLECLPHTPLYVLWPYAKQTEKKRDSPKPQETNVTKYVSALPCC